MCMFAAYLSLWKRGARWKVVHGTSAVVVGVLLTMPGTSNHAGYLKSWHGDPNVGSSSPSVIKKRKKPSDVWEEMREYRDADGNVKAECNHCKKTFDGSKRDTSDEDFDHLSNRERDFSDEKGQNWDDLDPSVLKSRKDEILQLYQEEKEKLHQFLKNLSCRFSLQLVCAGLGPIDVPCFLVVHYIDDSWQQQSKIISFWVDDADIAMEYVKESCLSIHGKICSVLVPFQIHPAYDEESWFSQQGSLPFFGCVRNADRLMDYIDGVLRSEDYFRDGIKSLKECAHYVVNKSGSDERIQLDGDVQRAICWLNRVPDPWGHFKYFATAMGFKEAFFELGQLDSDFRSINLTEQKWDDVTATFEHLKFLKDAAVGFSSGKCDTPIIVDLPYVHKILKDRCNHPIEDCLFCKKVMKAAIDLYFSNYYSIRAIAVILDPRFKMDGVQLRCKEIYGSDADRYLEKINEDFRDVYDAYAATDSDNSKSYEKLDAIRRPSSPKSKLDLYMKELKVPAVEQFDILAWRRGNAPFYPTLARMARDYLALKSPFDHRAAAEGAMAVIDKDVLCHYLYDKDIPEI
ncbi:zinc finger BED domain-containing protein DAYSLEEPER [Citrus sinensis]|uniref:Zinc finger BED domain-containing protein DAYSLEEPER n=1 Tax=Citrus sinensis TaxID=2711 RepID=A0ACB8MDU3_CITSI|nr:zinc finger BED domain-containing protein DAYSLEEPER [Citrus sinensis]